MSKWLFQRLFDHQDHPTPRFAFQGTLNWMRALAVLVDTTAFEENELIKFYSKVSRRVPNREADTLVYENILMALHNISALEAISNSTAKYNLVRAGIISWYYTIYCTCSAMVAAQSGANTETHSGTAKVWQKDIVENNLVLPPFCYYLDNLVPKQVESKINSLRGNNRYDLNICAVREEEAWGGAYSYLKGTAGYEREKVEEEIKQRSEFKKLGVTNFRTKAAREIRDQWLSKSLVNFLVQAFRYSGKANYRDSIYLSYGEDRSKDITMFCNDMEIVARKFLRTAVHFLSKRTERGTWAEFVDDARQNARFCTNIDLIEI